MGHKDRTLQQLKVVWQQLELDLQAIIIVIPMDMQDFQVMVRIDPKVVT